MKRMIVFLFLSILMIAFSFFKSNDFDFIKCNKLVIVSKYEIEESDKIIQSGNQYYNIFSANNVNEYLQNRELIDADGYVFYFEKERSKEDFEKMLGFSLANPSNIDGYDCYYGFYNGYKDFRYVDGKKINFQLIQTEEEWVLGFPVILTGY